MGLTTMNKNRTILITGKTGTGKSTKAKTFVKEPLIVYANDIDFDLFSFPIENGIIIEDVHYKPDKDAILSVIRNYKGQVVLTSINEKSVPKEIKTMCQIKRAGSVNHLRNEIATMAVHSEEPSSYERDTYGLVNEYLRESDRDLMAKLLLFNKPSDTQIITWLSQNMHPNKLIFVDGVVKRRWSQRYFYEMLAYAHSGKSFGRLSMPQRKAYSQIPKLARRLGVKSPRVLRQLCMDEDLVSTFQKKLNNAECRILGLGEKKKRTTKKRTPEVKEVKSLVDFM
tara:strand:+ start:286 stop:1134 length:849 start_codon:yes stop_codon:yes gene_type:complete